MEITILMNWKGKQEMEVRDHFVEEAKTELILFKGTKKECEEWCDEHYKDNPDRILIIRKGKE